MENSSNELKLAKGNTNGIQRILRIPLVRPSQLVASEAYYIQVDIGLRAASGNSSPMLFLSNNRNAVGFVLPSTMGDTTAVCSGTEGEETFPNGLTQARVFGGTITGSNQTDPGDEDSDGGSGDSKRRRRQAGDSDDDSDDSDDNDDDSDDSDDSNDDSNEDSDDDIDDDSDDSDDDSDDSDDSEDDDTRISEIEGRTPTPQLASESNTPSVPTVSTVHGNTGLAAHVTRMLFKPRNSWGSCTATKTTGATNVVMFTLPTNPQNGLFLDIYLGSQEQGIGLKFILIKLALERSPIA